MLQKEVSNSSVLSGSWEMMGSGRSPFSRDFNELVAVARLNSGWLLTAPLAEAGWHGGWSEQLSYRRVQLFSCLLWISG